ncbi:hypothetical protein CRQ34_22565 [Salmonella enterica subsp. enterica serovar Livingstone]|nr:hypothetical protein [Salmonella enterica subsp. enterica serovar Livingstone]
MMLTDKIKQREIINSIMDIEDFFRLYHLLKNVPFSNPALTANSFRILKNELSTADISGYPSPHRVDGIISDLREEKFRFVREKGEQRHIQAIQQAINQLKTLLAVCEQKRPVPFHSGWYIFCQDSRVIQCLLLFWPLHTLLCHHLQWCFISSFLYTPLLFFMLDQPNRTCRCATIQIISASLIGLVALFLI